MLVVALPLVILPGILFHYDTTPKIALLALVVAIFLVRPGAIAKTIPALWNRRSGRWLSVVAMAQVLWFGIGTALSSRPWVSLLGANWRRMGLLTVVSLVIFVVFAAAHFCVKREEITGVLRAFAIATIAASIYGIFQYYDIDPFQTVAAYHAQAGNATITRPPGPLGHADFFGWWLAIALFCGLAVERAETGAWRAVGLAACILSGVAILLTGTRSAAVAVLAGLVLLSFRAHRTQIPRRRLTAAVLLTALLLVFYFSPAGTRLRARVRWSADEPLGGARPLLWRDSLRMAASRPLTGFGPETFSAMFPLYESTELARLFPDFYHESPHNTALDALTSEGIPGLLLALAWIALGLFAANRLIPRDSPIAQPLAAALLASCVASMFTAVTLGPLFATGIVLSILVALVPKDAAQNAPENALGDARPHLKLNLLAALAVALPIALCLVAYASVLTASDFALALFQRSNGPPAVAAYSSFVRKELPGAAEDLYCARRLVGICGTILNPASRAECRRIASLAASRATSSDDNPPNAWYNLAQFAAAQNDAAGTEDALKSASTLAPNWFKPHWALASLMILVGRRNEARTEAERASFLDAGKDPEVTETLRELTAPAY
jgi:O-antigen ligase